MRFAAVLVVMTSLAGCAQYDEARNANLAAAAQERVAADEAKCQQAGAQPGSPAYDDCRKRLANQRSSGDRGHSRLIDQMSSGSSLRPIGE
jgi:hypothetical protein